MKKFFLTFAAAVLTTSASAQGVVTFANASSTPGWANPLFDRYVHWDAGLGGLFTPYGLVASNSYGLNLTSLRAALYYAASTQNDISLFTPASGGSATFKASTSATVGSWFGGNRTLDTIPNGVTANLVVLVWDLSLASDPLSGNARGGIWGASSIFQYTPPSNPQAQPSDFLMTGLTAFTVGVPEPSTAVLTLLAIGALVRSRRPQSAARLRSSS